jgi:hypothetical protein
MLAVVIVFLTVYITHLYILEQCRSSTFPFCDNERLIGG